MSNNENIQGSRKDSTANTQKEQTGRAQEATIPGREGTDKFPKWDILPPHQFINPRIKKAE